MPEKKESDLGIALFLYAVAIVLAILLAYNIWNVGLFKNLGLVENLKAPTESSGIISRVVYFYVSIYFPYFGNTAPCVVISVLIPVLIAITLIASLFLSKHLFFKSGGEHGEQQIQHPTDSDSEGI